MRSLAVRVIILVLFVVAAGVSTYLFWTGESRARGEKQSGRQFDERAGMAARDALELRAAQQAYVAAGQGEQFWIARVSTATTALRDTLAALKPEATAPEAQTAVENASDALGDFEKMDGRARDYTQGGQKLMASDLVFSAGLETTAGIVAFLDQARIAEAQARDESLSGIRRRQLFALGAVAASALLALLLLVPRPHVHADFVARIESARSAGVRGGLGLSASDEGWSPPRKVATPSPAPAVIPAKPATTLDLAGIAGVCTDLARIENTQSLPSILERAAAALDASGIALWIADPDGQELAPVLTHGYAPQVVSRLARIARGAENATAAAFRTGLLQTVNADVMSEGAIAAPLLTHAGCVGVMAAEVRNAGEKDSAKLAAASIVAAQISTLVGPPPSRAQAAEAAGA